MFGEAKMNNVHVNHGSWQTTSLLSLLKVELQVTNAAFERYKDLSFLRFEENRAPNALLAFNNLPLKLWSLQMTSIITWNNDEIWGWCVRVCQGRICVGSSEDVVQTPWIWDDMKQNLQQWHSLTGFLPVHGATLTAVQISEILRVRQTSQMKETSRVCCLIHFAASLHKQSCWYSWRGSVGVEMP